MSSSNPSLPGQDGRNMGDARSTALATDSALQLFEVYRSRKGKGPLESIRFVEIEGENLENEIFQLCCWISQTPIPAYFDKDLQPPRSTADQPTRLIMVTSLSKYVGKIILYHRDKFPSHPDFNGLKKRTDVPEWWTRMRPTFERECQRFHTLLGSEYTFGETTTQPLYHSNHPRGLDVDDDGIGCFLQQIDLLSILRKLFRDASNHCNREGKLQQRCWLVLLYLAVGRGGEIKLQDFNDWVYHPLFEVTDISWTEVKLFRKYTMPMVPHRIHFLLDFYHALGCFWFVERGLFRADEDQLAISNFVFPDLHSCKDAQVAKKVTKVIRENLPQGCPKKIVDSFSAKSTRRGSITELLAHPSIQVTDACARSGHTTGTSLDSYVDNTFFVLGLRAAKALCGYDNVHTNIKVPRLECLGEHTATTVQVFLDKAFVVSVPGFLEKRGPLYHILRICFASLIMHHIDATREFGDSNVVVTKLRNAARQANIGDVRFPNLSPEIILDKWSEIIMKDFRERNPEIAQIAPNSNQAQMIAVLNQQSSLLLELKGMMKNVMELRAEDHRKIVSQETTITALNEQVSSLQEEVNIANRKLAIIRTPPSQPQAPSHLQDEHSPQSPSKFRRLNNSSVEVATSRDVAPTSMTVPPQPTTAATALSRLTTAMTMPTATTAPRLTTAGVPPTKAAAPVARQLTYGAEARQVAEQKSNKKLFVSTILQELQRNGQLKVPVSVWKSIAAPLYIQEKWAFKNMMELVQKVISDDEKTTLAADIEDETLLEKCTRNIEKRCMEQMLKYEGIDPEIDKKTGGKKEGTYLALGRRIKLYKKELQKLLNKDEDVPLQDRPPPITGTPEGATSIRKFFSRKNH